MAVSADILRSWVAPRRVVSQLLSAPQREGRALSFLLIGCLLIFVAQGPRLMREVSLAAPGAQDGSGDLLTRMTYELFGWLILWPLVIYLAAFVIHAVLRALGGRARGYDTRIAVFWGLLASTPAALLYGLVTGFIGPGTEAAITGALWLAGLAGITLAGLIEVGWRRE